MRKSALRLLLGLVCVLIATWLVAPTLVIVPMSFTGKKSLAFPPQGISLQWYENFFMDPQWFGSLVVSLKVAILVSLVATAIGTMAAIGLNRMRSRAGQAINAALLTPMILPDVVLAVGIYAVYLNLKLVGTWTGYIAAHTVLAIPFVVIAVSASLSVFDQRLVTAAASLGASPLATFRSVTLPLIMPGVLSGALFAFVTSFDEVIISIFITSPHLKTLPVMIFSSITRDSDPTVAAVGSMTFVITTMAIGLGLFYGMRRFKN